MALITFRPPVGPSPGTSFKPQVKLLEAEFGDGYSQATPDGLNHIRETVELKWDALTQQEMTQINTFLTSRKGVEAFYYKPAGYTRMAKWTCKEWSRNLSDGVWKIQANFIQSFSNEI